MDRKNLPPPSLPYYNQAMAKFLLASIFLSVNWSAQAAPAMLGSLCGIVGLVQKIEVRKKYYNKEKIPSSAWASRESWRKSWGLPQYRIYHDATVSVNSTQKIRKNAFMGNCDQFLGKKIFQIKNKKELKKLENILKKSKAGKCIRGKTESSGDEFVWGQWLFEVEHLAIENCADKTPLTTPPKKTELQSPKN